LEDARSCALRRILGPQRRASRGWQ